MSWFSKAPSGTSSAAKPSADESATSSFWSGQDAGSNSSSSSSRRTYGGGLDSSLPSSRSGAASTVSAPQWIRRPASSVKRTYGSRSRSNSINAGQEPVVLSSMFEDEDSPDETTASVLPSAQLKASTESVFKAGGKSQQRVTATRASRSPRRTRAAKQATSSALPPLSAQQRGATGAGKAVAKKRVPLRTLTNSSDHSSASDAKPVEAGADTDWFDEWMQPSQPSQPDAVERAVSAPVPTTRTKPQRRSTSESSLHLSATKQPVTILGGLVFGEADRLVIGEKRPRNSTYSDSDGKGICSTPGDERRKARCRLSHINSPIMSTNTSSAAASSQGSNASSTTSTVKTRQAASKRAVTAPSLTAPSRVSQHVSPVYAYAVIMARS
eukprot:9661-Heterococcus_DN1.PRE.3